MKKVHSFYLYGKYKELETKNIFLFFRYDTLWKAKRDDSAGGTLQGLRNLSVQLSSSSWTKRD